MGWSEKQRAKTVRLRCIEGRPHRMFSDAKTLILAPTQNQIRFVADGFAARLRIWLGDEKSKLGFPRIGVVNRRGC